MARVEEKIKPHEKPDILLEAVMTKNPNEAERVYRSLGTVDFTAYALGLACRFRGLEMVKMLIENGARFDYDLMKIKCAWRFDPMINDGVNYAAALLNYVGILEINDFDFLSRKYGLEILPINDRLAVINYLCETADKTGFDKDGLLFYSYFSGERVITDHLKEKGAVIPEMWVKIITECGWDDESKNKWFDYCFLIERLSDNDFIPCISALVSEISEMGGRKLHFTEWLWHVGFEYRQNITGINKFLLENYDLSKVNKTKMMKFFINKNSIDGLAAVAELGWLKMPKKRDEMIAYSTEKGKTECTAWLLDFKNRTADLAGERARAEKKAQRELNADPNSVTELKKIWSWEKREDGTLIITGYKGNKTEITVPEKLCGDTVTAIGEHAFSPDAKRLRAEQREFRKTITEIKLPDTVTEIGEFAFAGCSSLARFDIPPRVAQISQGMLERSGINEIVIGGNVQSIDYRAFYKCSGLKKAVLCEGIKEINSVVFVGCGVLNTVEIPRSVTELSSNWIVSNGNTTVVLYKNSYAEQFCAEEKISFKYKE